LENIRYVWAKNRCVYGREKLLVALNKHLSCLNLELTTDSKLRRLMKLSGISSQLKKKNRYKEWKNTSVSYPNLIKRKFKPNKPYEKLFTDVAYFKTPSGNLYVSVIIDTFDNKVLSWSISTINDNTLVMSVLNKIRVNISKAIIHSDHGCQYSSHEYQGWLKQNDCTCSMSRVGNSLDNYPIEHHFSFLKQECLRAISWDNRTILNISNELKLYYKWFNEERVQTCLNYRTPNQVHGMIYNNSRKVVQL
jgi:transposase InsO family protein